MNPQQYMSKPTGQIRSLAKMKEELADKDRRLAELEAKVSTVATPSIVNDELLVKLEKRLAKLEGFTYQHASNSRLHPSLQSVPGKLPSGDSAPHAP
jgi:hypothetical protein